jgi:hypothetical protein
MTRHLITFINGFEEVSAVFIDDRELDIRPDASLDNLIAAWRKPIEYKRHKTWGIPPEIVYSCTDRLDVEATYIVYRESDTGDLLYEGAVKEEVIRPPISYDELQSSE